MKIAKFLFFLSISVTSYGKEPISIPNCDDLTKSLEQIQECANQGDYFMQYNLGVMYRDGINVSRNDQKSFYWLNKSAEQGFAAAQVNVGQLYELGIGVKKDPKEAFYWTYKAAMQNELAAVNNLGTYALKGFGTERSVERAVKLYRLAAENNFSDAQLNLASLYFLGIGVEKNLSKAIFWSEKSAHNGNAMAMAQLGIFYRYNKQYDKSFQWTDKSAKLNNPMAQANLAYLYSFGDGGKKDQQLAKVFLNKAISQNNKYANAIIGSIYETGNNIFLKNEKESIKFYLKSANEDVLEAIIALYRIYSKGTKEIPQRSSKCPILVRKGERKRIYP